MRSLPSFIVSILASILLLLPSACATSRQPPESTPIETGIRVWMLGQPGTARFLAVISPWKFWNEHIGPANFDRIMLEQSGHVFLCDALTGSVTKLCVIPVPESVPGFLIEIDGVRFRVIGWDDQAAYIELRGEPTKLEGGYEPFAWYRAAIEGGCTPLTERPTGLPYGYDIPGYPGPRRGPGYPFPSADDFVLVSTDGFIELGDGVTTLAKFTVDPVTYDILPVDLGPDSKRLLREAMERESTRPTKRPDEHEDDE